MTSYAVPHHVPTLSEGGMWVAQGSPPAFYPDLISEEKFAAVSAVVDSLRGRATCSVKDSWATLDLSGEGFIELFTAEWIYRDPEHSDGTGLDWTIVTELEQLDEWETAAELRGLVTAGLLAEPSLRVLLARREDKIAGGATTNTSDSVVGLSNVFAVLNDDLAVVWGDLPVVVDRSFPGRPLVGYEHGDDLEAARSAGFRVTGPLRIWLRQ